MEIIPNPNQTYEYEKQLPINIIGGKETKN